MTTTDKTKTLARDAQVIAGIQKHLNSVSALPLGGSTYAPADVVKIVQGRIDATAIANTTKAAWHSNVLAGRKLDTQVTPVVRALRTYVINVYGAASPVLADFGFAAPKATTRTPEEKAAAAAKAKATRAARHTMGKNQKKSVKGTVATLSTSGGAPPPTPSTTTSAVAVPSLKAPT
jgi:hypothetical protein